MYMCKLHKHLLLPTYVHKCKVKPDFVGYEAFTLVE
jgi:hypothetical protein